MKSRENTKITFNVSIREKKKLKTQAINNNKTLSDYVRSLIFSTEKQQTAEERINEINNILSTNGMNMTREEREQLKAERELLKGGEMNG